jgi:branched-chain amino acid transport system permease protein
VVLSLFVFYPLRKHPEVSLLITALGLVLIIEAGAFKLWGDAPRVIPGAPEKILHILSARLTVMRAVIVVVTAVVVLALHLFVQRTRTGRAMKAMAVNSYAAQLMGIPVRRYSAIAFAIGSALAGLGGGLLGTIFPVQTNMGAGIALKSFIIIIFAGMGSIGGAWLGGLILGLVESFGATFISSAYVDTFAFIFLVAVLLMRPNGLFALGQSRD